MRYLWNKLGFLNPIQYGKGGRQKKSLIPSHHLYIIMISTKWWVRSTQKYWKKSELVMGLSWYTFIFEHYYILADNCEPLIPLLRMVFILYLSQVWNKWFHLNFLKSTQVHFCWGFFTSSFKVWFCNFLWIEPSWIFLWVSAFSAKGIG